MRASAGQWVFKNRRYFRFKNWFDRSTPFGSVLKKSYSFGVILKKLSHQTAKWTDKFRRLSRPSLCSSRFHTSRLVRTSRLTICSSSVKARRRKSSSFGRLEFIWRRTDKRFWTMLYRLPPTWLPNGNCGKTDIMYYYFIMSSIFN